jgi:hypothetical protein
VTFDPTISLSDLISTATLLIGLFLAYNGITNRMVSLEIKVGEMWEHFIEKVKAKQ